MIFQSLISLLQLLFYQRKLMHGSKQKSYSHTIGFFLMGRLVVSPSWNASSILAKNTATFTSFNLIVTGTMTIFGATAEPLPFYYYSARPILNATLIANCAGMTEGTLQLPASSNYSVSSILSVSQDCGLIRKITAVLEETETTTLVNTTGVTLSDVFEELSVSGIMPAGSKGNSAMKASATSSFIEWLLEPGSISISGSSEAQVSITPTLEFYPQLNFQFIVSGWRVELISLELVGNMAFGISLSATITAEAS